MMEKLLYKDRQGLQPSPQRVSARGQHSRNHQFDLLRIIFATLVLLSHAPEITDGNASRELFYRFIGPPITLGAVGVDGFFVLSGYLIVQSWLANPELLNFLRKRVLRIVPGYLVAVVLSTLAVGLLAPGVPRFFASLDGHFFRSIVLLSSPMTPPVFPGHPYALVNGAMFTIGYEFRCYLLVALLGLCGLFRRPIFVLIATLLLLVSLVDTAPLGHLHWPRPAEALFGQPVYALRLTAIYLVGCCFYLFRRWIPFRRPLAWTAMAAIVLSFAFVPSKAELPLVLGGAYLMFYLGQTHLPWLAGMAKLPDISYGIYLYGWPVESLWIWFHRGSPWVAFLGSAVLCFALGWLSWHFVERPALALKRRPTAPLPAP